MCALTLTIITRRRMRHVTPHNLFQDLEPEVTKSRPGGLVLDGFWMNRYDEKFDDDFNEICS